jgi:bifunctional non-homologous end joining protein LigD
LRDQPLEQRRAQLKRLLNRSKGNLIRYSDSFADAFALLAICIRLSLEGIVCKRQDAPYRSGTCSGWIKIKTDQWKAANKYRAKLFAKT